MLKNKELKSPSKKRWHRYLSRIATLTLMLMAIATTALADEATDAIGNLSETFGSIVSAVGGIAVMVGVVQLGMSLKGHDPSQRSQALLTIAGGIVIAFAPQLVGSILGTGGGGA